MNRITFIEGETGGRMLMEPQPEQPIDTVYGAEGRMFFYEGKHALAVHRTPPCSAGERVYVGEGWQWTYSAVLDRNGLGKEDIELIVYESDYPNGYPVCAWEWRSADTLPEWAGRTFRTVAALGEPQHYEGKWYWVFQVYCMPKEPEPTNPVDVIQKIIEDAGLEVDKAIFDKARNYLNELVEDNK